MDPLPVIGDFKLGNGQVRSPKVPVYRGQDGVEWRWMCGVAYPSGRTTIISLEGFV